MEEAGSWRSPQVYLPIDWSVFNLCFVDVLHLGITMATHFCQYIGNKLLNYGDQTVIDDICDIIQDDMRIRLCFGKQFRDCFESKNFKITLTHRDSAYVLFRMYDVLSYCINYWIQTRRDRAFIFIVLLKLLSNAQIIRSSYETVEYENGLNDEKFIVYQSASVQRYKLILQMLYDYIIPHEMMNFYVIQHKLRNIIFYHGYGLGICSTSMQEHIPKLEKNVACKHSNYDWDELVRHSNSSDIAYGIDSVIACDVNLDKLRQSNLNHSHLRYGQQDKGKLAEVLRSLHVDAASIYHDIDEQDFNERVGSKFKKFMSRKRKKC